jgi:histidinol-phosphatase
MTEWRFPRCRPCSPVGGRVAAVDGRHAQPQRPYTPKPEADTGSPKPEPEAMSLSEYLEFATEAAWIAGQSTLAHFQTGVDVEHKADRSPVTIADRAAEGILRELIGGRFPDHAVLGEEYGQDDRRSSHRWVLDPIDGTQSFIRGVPLYGVLVALEIAGVPRVGVCHFPALRETFAAASGLGCWWNGRRARVAPTRTLADAAVGYSDSRMLSKRLGSGLQALHGAVRVLRGWGDCYGHCLVASGRLDAMLDPAMNPWDCCALVPILQEAGGAFTDWTGATRIDGGDAFSTNGTLHEELGRLLRAIASGLG